ncbi:hypothetical protein ALSL_2615 [Aerosticca soli]|uniref:Uncharacterized protein n=1 Tax=Aerosticca soli TaxID=2010829 RepID=A0A2Z6E963_9GAMM|nr:hypothetical protein ALSL_2615 [Aerosticca soli]
MRAAGGQRRRCAHGGAIGGKADRLAALLREQSCRPIAWPSAARAKSHRPVAGVGAALGKASAGACQAFCTVSRHC